MNQVVASTAEEGSLEVPESMPLWFDRVVKRGSPERSTDLPRSRGGCGPDASIKAGAFLETTMRTAALDQVLTRRLQRHHLARRAPRGDLVAVVRDTAGIQAQLLTAAQLSLWCRVEELHREDVERALWEERSLVKIWAMRGTVHLLPARDLPLYVAGLRRSALPGAEGWLGRHGLGPRDFEAFARAAEEALAEGPLTRRELADQVVAVAGEGARRWVQHGWGGLVKVACLQGRVCFGPNRGQEVTFVRRDAWIPGWVDLRAEEAEEELVRRYLRAYGPATPADFAYWAGMRVGAAKRLWGRLEDELVPIPATGMAASLLAEDAETLAEAPPPDGVVRLLPFFDVYLLGHRDKGHLVGEAHYKRVYRKAGWISPTVLVDGRVEGVWSQEEGGERVRIVVEPFAPLAREVKEGLETEAERLGRFLEVTAELVLV